MVENKPLPVVAVKPENKSLSWSILVARTCSSIQLCSICARQFHCTYHFWLKCIFHEDRGKGNFKSWRISLSIMPDAKVFVPVSMSKMLCCKLPRYVPYKCTYVPYDGTFGTSNQGQMLDV